MALARQWCKANRMKNCLVKRILKQARKALKNPTVQEFTWLYPEGAREPPKELIWVGLKPSAETTFKTYSHQNRPSDYTPEEAEKILADLKFGENLKVDQRADLITVVKENIQAFSREKGDLGYTTLIEHEIDLVDDKPVKMRPYKLLFEEQKVAAEFVQRLMKEEQFSLTANLPGLRLPFWFPNQSLVNIV